MGAVLKPAYLIAGLAVVAALVVAAKGADKTGQALGAGAVDLVGGVLTGGVLAIGDGLGIPRTDATKGEQEFAAGDYWRASFDMPAGDFIGAVWRKITN